MVGLAARLLPAVGRRAVNIEEAAETLLMACERTGTPTKGFHGPFHRLVSCYKPRHADGLKGLSLLVYGILHLGRAKIFLSRGWAGFFADCSSK